MARRMARVHCKGDAGRNGMAVVDQLCLACIKNGLHTVFEHIGVHLGSNGGRAGFFAVAWIPVGPVDTGEQIASIGKRRYPVLVLQACIPADVIDMQVRADHDIDVFRLQSVRRQIGKEGRIEAAKYGNTRALFVVTCPGVVEDCEVTGPDDPAL